MEHRCKKLLFRHSKYFLLSLCTGVNDSLKFRATENQAHYFSFPLYKIQRTINTGPWDQELLESNINIHYGLEPQVWLSYWLFFFLNIMICKSNSWFCQNWFTVLNSWFGKTTFLSWVVVTKAAIRTVWWELWFYEPLLVLDDDSAFFQLGPYWLGWD